MVNLKEIVSGIIVCSMWIITLVGIWLSGLTLFVKVMASILMGIFYLVIARIIM
jgi:hypothetical protein